MKSGFVQLHMPSTDERLWSSAATTIIETDLLNGIDETLTDIEL